MARVRKRLNGPQSSGFVGHSIGGGDKSRRTGSSKSSIHKQEIVITRPTRHRRARRRRRRRRATDVEVLLPLSAFHVKVRGGETIACGAQRLSDSSPLPVLSFTGPPRPFDPSLFFGSLAGSSRPLHPSLILCFILSCKHTGFLDGSEKLTILLGCLQASHSVRTAHKRGILTRVRIAPTCAAWIEASRASLICASSSIETSLDVEGADARLPPRGPVPGTGGEPGRM
jgi:hypothetical protein